jgi:hypothetical protein
MRLVGAVVRVLAAGRAVVGDSVCGAGASILRRTFNRGVCCLQRVRRPSPISHSLRAAAVCWGQAFEARVFAGRDVPWLL